MESQATVHPVRTSAPGRAGWREEETSRLFAAVREAGQQGVPLRAVFESLSGEMGRKPNSIRNYYYACLRQHPDDKPRSPAFTAFTPEETHELLRQVLMARGRGVSVRACVMQLSGGSQSRMLRYQNKYRTILKSRPEMIARVCEELKQEGLPCPSMPRPAFDRADSAFCDPEDAAASRLMAQPCVHHMLEGLKELLRRAARAEAADDAALSRLGEMQQALDRQQVDFDLRRIAFEKDYDACRDQLQQVTAALRAVMIPGGDMEEAAERAMDALRAAESFLSAQAGRA